MNSSLCVRYPDYSVSNFDAIWRTLSASNCERGEVQSFNADVISLQSCGALGIRAMKSTIGHDTQGWDILLGNYLRTKWLLDTMSAH